MENKNNIWIEKDRIVKITPFTENKTGYASRLKDEVNILVT
jgi:hypothetical protein